MSVPHRWCSQPREAALKREAAVSGAHEGELGAASDLARSPTAASRRTSDSRRPGVDACIAPMMAHSPSAVANPAIKLCEQSGSRQRRPVCSPGIRVSVCTPQTRMGLVDWLAKMRERKGGCLEAAGRRLRTRWRTERTNERTTTYVPLPGDAKVSEVWPRSCLFFRDFLRDRSHTRRESAGSFAGR